MQNKFLDKTKIVFNGTLLVVALMIIGFTYTFFTYDTNVAVKSSALDGQFFKILKTFRDEKINFSNLEDMLHKTFEDLEDTRSFVSPDTGRGRVNPFAQ